MINKSVNEFYTQFLFKIDAFPKDVAFPLEITAAFFNNLSPDVRKFFISEGVQVPPRPSTEINHQVNQRLLLVINAEMEAEKRTRKIKATVQPEIRIRHTKKFMGMLEGQPSTQMVGLGSSFKSE